MSSQDLHVPAIPRDVEREWEERITREVLALQARKDNEVQELMLLYAGTMFNPEYRSKRTEIDIAYQEHQDRIQERAEATLEELERHFHGHSEPPPPPRYRSPSSSQSSADDVESDSSTTSAQPTSDEERTTTTTTTSSADTTLCSEHEASIRPGQNQFWPLAFSQDNYFGGGLACAAISLLSSFCFLKDCPLCIDYSKVLEAGSVLYRRQQAEAASNRNAQSGTKKDRERGMEIVNNLLSVKDVLRVVPPGFFDDSEIETNDVIAAFDSDLMKEFRDKNGFDADEWLGLTKVLDVLRENAPAAATVCAEAKTITVACVSRSGPQGFWLFDSHSSLRQDKGCTLRFLPSSEALVAALRAYFLGGMDPRLLPFEAQTLDIRIMHRRIEPV